MISNIYINIYNYTKKKKNIFPIKMKETSNCNKIREPLGAEISLNGTITL